MSWKELRILSCSFLLHRLFLKSNAFLTSYGTININPPYNIQRILLNSFNLYAILKDDNKVDDDQDDDDDDDDTIIAYKNRSLSWTKRYRALLPYEYARRRVLSLGLQSKAEWDEYVSDGKRGNGKFVDCVFINIFT